MLLIASFNFSKNDEAILGGYDVNIAFVIRSDCNITNFSNSAENKVSELPPWKIYVTRPCHQR